MRSTFFKFIVNCAGLEWDIVLLKGAQIYRCRSRMLKMVNRELGLLDTPISHGILN